VLATFENERREKKIKGKKEEEKPAQQVKEREKD